MRKTVLFLMAALLWAGFLHPGEASETHPVTPETGSLEMLDLAETIRQTAVRQSWTPFMRDLAERNVDMANKLIGLAEKSAQAQSKTDLMQERLSVMNQNLDTIKERIRTMGLTPSVAALLQKRRRNIAALIPPKTLTYDRRAEIRRIHEEDLHLELLSGELDRLGPEILADKIRRMNLTSEEQHTATQTLNQAVALARDLISCLNAAHAAYLGVLGNQSYVNKALRLQANEYIEFIDLNLLWARSNQTFGKEDVLLLGHAAALFFSPAKWEVLLQDFSRSLATDPAGWVTALILLMLWLCFRFKNSYLLQTLNRRLQQTADSSIVATAAALAVLSVAAALLPLLISVSAGMLTAFPQSREFTHAVASALTGFAKILFFTSLVRMVVLPGGLAQTHFKLPETVCCVLRQFAFRYLTIIGPLAFALIVVNTGLGIPLRSSLGRVLFFADLAVTALILIPVLRPGGAVFSSLSPQSIFFKARNFWMPIALLVLTSMIVISFLGYYRTGLLLSINLTSTLVFIGALVLTQLFLKRWIGLSAAGSSPDAPQGTPPTCAMEASSLTRILIGITAAVGLYQIWSNEIPLAGFLNAIILWTYEAGVDMAQNPIIKSITLGDLTVCLMILAVTWLTTRNIYSMLDLIFFRRLEVDPGSRHAISLILKYLVTVIGLFAALNIIGISWSKFQWLVAALTVGLGFGLQEIVANFVSGIILLFERPIRVGDTIAVGGVEGKVARIQIRATTIIDWDNKEVQIPNKTLLTTNISNWTLSDQLVRVVVPVGIAYGSDVRKAEEILLRVARDNPLTVDDPVTSVIFTGFGDSSLDLKLRTFVKSSDRMAAINLLHLEINDAFNQAGIEIAFPQRDMHLDTLRPLDVKIIKPDS